MNQEPEHGRYTIARQPRLIVGEGALGGLPALLQADGRRAVAVVTGGRSIRGRDQWAALVDDLLDGDDDFLEFTVRGEPSPESVDAIVADLRRDLPTCDTVVAIGGGSVIDTAKAVAAGVALSPEEYGASIRRFLEGVGDAPHPGRTLPLYAVPSTAGTGSEATKNAVLSNTGNGGFKKSLRHDHFIPDTAIIDPEIQIGCPPAVTQASGLDALTQLLEVYVSRRARPGTDALAAEGLRRGGAALLRLLRGEDGPGLRRDMALAAYWSGVGLANAGLGLVHGFASPLGAAHEIPHGVVCGILVGPTTRAQVRALAAAGEAGWEGLERYATAARLVGAVPAADSVDRESAGLRLADWLEERAVGLGRLTDYGFDAGELESLAAASGLKDSPASLDVATRTAILREVV